MNYPKSNYSEFSVEDFIMDPFFKEWVIQSSPEADEFWIHWKEENPSKVEILEDAKKAVLALEKSQFTLKEEEFKEIWKGINSSKTQKPAIVEKTKRRLAIWPYASAAAFLVLLLAFFWIRMPKEIEYLTGYGETQKIILPDSSIVILNASSKLTFIDNWESEAAREIWIEGEAFFEVKHMQDHQPFKVWSSNGIGIEVLGTEFNVYNRSNETEVVLNSGVVSLSFPVKEKEGKILMKPGEMVQFKDSKFQKKEVNASLYTSWKDDVLNLDETSLKDILNVAKTNYGVDVEIENEAVLELTASGSMPLSDAENFMKQVSMIFNIEITKEENKYLIK
ncbi:FecR family protein [Algoriphagus pacificus]|uniref:FecR family protein n=1 Tax=Algoriphagus pacificus TaxID=2811234 RepID=A0ABS3CED5_9BACT|nr:FecR domain-containing protein [Algoriphagus pacificus]MBN7815465.1 FecR family protein [Algoriphagus pacificus]